MNPKQINSMIQSPLMALSTLPAVDRSIGLGASPSFNPSPSHGARADLQLGLRACPHRQNPTGSCSLAYP